MTGCPRLVRGENEIERLAAFGRLIFLALWAGLLFLIATNIQSGWLYVVISFMLILAAVSVAAPKSALRAVSLEAALPDLCERGSPATAVLTIRNNSRFSRHMLRIESLSCPGIRFEPDRVFIVSLPARSSLTVSARFVPESRGRLKMERAAVSCGAPLGIFTARREFPLRAVSLAHPRVDRAEGEALAEYGGRADPRANPARFELRDSYNYRLREYVPGDSLRQIHWKLTARAGEPIVKQNDGAAVEHAGIFIDNDAANYPPGSGERFERLLEQAASLAHHLVFARGAGVSITASAAPGITVDSPDSWERALRWLALIELQSGNYPLQPPGPDADFTFSPLERTEASG